jgi:hypothetical protein
MIEPATGMQVFSSCILFCFWTLILAVILAFKRPAGFKTHFWRFVLVFGLSLFGAISMGMLSLVISNGFLPRTDLAYRLGTLGVFHDPFQVSGMFFFSIPVGVFISPLYFVCTREKNLLRSAIFIHTLAAITVAVMSVLGPFFAGFASPPFVMWSFAALNHPRFVAFFSKGVNP